VSDILYNLDTEGRSEEMREASMRGDHSQDTDCTLDRANCCIVCGVYHGDPCPLCGGRRYHDAKCDEIENTLRKANDEFTKTLLDIVRPVDPSNFPNPFDVDFRGDE
jgi:hypothetical protein